MLVIGGCGLFIVCDYLCFVVLLAFVACAFVCVIAWFLGFVLLWLLVLFDYCYLLFMVWQLHSCVCILRLLLCVSFDFWLVFLFVCWVVWFCLVL